MSDVSEPRRGSLYGADHAIGILVDRYLLVERTQAFDRATYICIINMWTSYSKASLIIDYVLYTLISRLKIFEF